jgi:hypothetical protein
MGHRAPMGWSSNGSLQPMGHSNPWDTHQWVTQTHRKWAAINLWVCASYPWVITANGKWWPMMTHRKHNPWEIAMGILVWALHGVHCSPLEIVWEFTANFCTKGLQTTKTSQNRWDLSYLRLLSEEASQFPKSIRYLNKVSKNWQWHSKEASQFPKSIRYLNKLLFGTMTQIHE